MVDVETIETARRALGVRLSEGIPGRAATAELSDAYDELLRQRWAQAISRVEGAEGAGLALVATGGWGRREVCPYSDIDFLLLAHARHTDLARKVADALLYPLWDAGLKVGHAVRDVGDTAKLARDDLATATALLDARAIAGDAALAEELSRATRKAIAPGGNPNDFVRKLADEKQRRHERFGASLYLLEPNLKHGIGGLRDLATAVWAARARWSLPDLESLVTTGELSSRQVGVLQSGLDFLLMLRSLLQLQMGRATDQLTFEIQEAIAPRLFPQVTPPAGDVRPAVAPAVEALMRRYYLHARAAVQVADRLLESATVVARRAPRVVKIDPTFVVFNGKLSVSDPQIFRDRPWEMLRLFRVALEHDLPIYGHTLELVTDNAAVHGTRLIDDREATRLFVDALIDPRDRDQPSLLEQMHQVGLLNAVMPEFAPCTCRVQHDLYHVYTVDQHQLYALAMLKRIARGELADEAPHATEALARVTRPGPLYLGTLLHDVGKPLGKGHADSGARIAGAIARRFGWNDRDVATTELLVRQHLTMSHLSQRRDLSDRELVRRFAERVGDAETLDMLYLLTRRDTAMTAPGNLNAWKDQLLTDLFLRARSQHAGAASPGDDVDQRVAELRELVCERMTRDLPPEAAADERARIGRFLDGIDRRFFTTLSPRQVIRHVELADARSRGGGPIAISVTCYPMKGHTELAIIADDTPGLLATIAGVLTAHRVSVDGAIVCTRDPRASGETGLALDLFFVRDLVGKPIPDDDARWERIRTDLAAISQSAHPAADVGALIAKRRPPSKLERRVTPGVPTQVELINDGSAGFTIVEVFTQDRVGVLHAITRTIAECGLDIHLSKISTEGEKAADVFYVTRRDGGGKLTEPDEIAALERALRGALAELA